MVYKSAYKCTVISFKTLLEMFPLIYSFFFVLYSIYILYIFCIKVKKKYFYCDFTSWVYLFTGDKINMTCSLFPHRWPFSLILSTVQKTFISPDTVLEMRFSGDLTFNDVASTCAQTI